MKTWIGFATSLLFVAQSAAQEAPKKAAPPIPTIQEVTQKLDDLYRSKSSHSKMTMTVINDRGTRKLTMEQWTAGDEKALIVIRKPTREAGTATLKTTEGLWNYAPRADRLLRIPTGLLSGNWMGSHFTNDDLVRETSFSEDYTTSLGWVEESAARFLLVAFTPKPDAPVIYTKIEYRMTPDTYIPIRADYFDRGKIVRTLTFSDIRVAGDRSVPFRMELVPANKPNEKTMIVYEELTFDIPVDEELFGKRGLRRMAKSR
jgi:hypothetical protein